MDAKIREKLKALFKKLNLNADTETFKEVKLADGSMLSYEGETPTAGAKVMVKDAEGVEAPAPDGDYTLEDGSILSVVAGLITEVKAAEEQAADPAADQEMDELFAWLFGFKKTDAPAMLARIKAVEDAAAVQLEAVNKELATVKAELKTTTELNAQMFSLVEKIAGLPAVESGFKKKEGMPDASKFKTLKDIADAARKLQSNFKS